MDTHQRNATVAGVLFITATLAGILLVVLTGSILDAPDYLVQVAAHENRIVIGALLQFTMAAACAGIAIWLYPVLKNHDAALALGSVGFRIIEAVLFMVAAAGLLSLLSSSQEYVQAGAPGPDHFQTLGTFIVAARAWLATGLGAIAFCLGALMYYYVFYRSRLIPRWLSGWGLFAATSHLVAATLVMFGQEPFSPLSLLLNLPILLQEMVLAVWLIVKGFNPAAIPSGSAPVDVNQVELARL